MHLWEAHHPYYCSESNYYSIKPGASYKSWGDFVSEFAEEFTDIDMNLIFRWDWREGEDYRAGEYNGDDYHRNGILQLFFIHQRKGIFACREVQVCRADEPAVIKYLKPHLERMKDNWRPLQ